MGQKKLIRFAAIKSFTNVLEYPDNMPGTWGSFFASPQPLTLELACGKGEYAVGLGQMFPQRNFLGVDVRSCLNFIAGNTHLVIVERNEAFR